MAQQIELAPELARLLQKRTQCFGAHVYDELARAVAEEEIINADVESGLMLDEIAAYSCHDELLAAFAVNDIVVNGVRVDVRAIDSDGRISINRALVGTRYMTAGTLAVALTDGINGKVVGFVSSEQWQRLDRSADDEQVLFLKAPHDESFAVASLLKSLPVQTPGAPSGSPPQAVDIATMVADRAQLSASKQKSLADYILGAENTWPQLKRVVESWSSGNTKRVITDAARWNRRVERIAALVAPRFKHLSAEQVRKIVCKIGESMGGQPESPAFRKLLLSTLSREELAHSLAGNMLRKACDVAESVLAGRAGAKAVKDAVPNKVAVQIASQIKEQQARVARFVDATAQELGTAFQRLSLQPAYATHSSDPSSGVESINEALKLMDAAEFAEAVKALDEAIAQV